MEDNRADQLDNEELGGLSSAQMQQQHLLQSQQLQQQQLQQIHQFWQQQMREIEDMSSFKGKSGLPLARIKKIMKFDEDVKMISAEAPVLFAKACEMFILELTLRAWIHTEENKRRTLQRNDLAMAIARNDTFDFLIDIVPREDIKGKQQGEELVRPAVITPELQQYYYQLAQQQVLAQQQTQQQVDPSMQQLFYQQQSLRLLQQAQLMQQFGMQPHLAGHMAELGQLSEQQMEQMGQMDNHQHHLGNELHDQHQLREQMGEHLQQQQHQHHQGLNDESLDNSHSQLDASNHHLAAGMVGAEHLVPQHHQQHSQQQSEVSRHQHHQPHDSL
ncbi:NFYC factor [Balamuthia mandrillaris]